MAAGQGFKTFTSGDVLTAADVNGYLMQGVGVFADATERDAEITSPEEGQFAYLKDTNVTTYYTGSAWANLDTTGMTNPMTTTGDTIYSSSGSTPARLGIGTAGQVLQVNSGATAPEWANAASGFDPILTPEISTLYIRNQWVTATAQLSPVLNRTYYIPVFLPTFTADRIAFQSNGFTSAGNARLGLYNASATTGLPTTVVFDAGTVNVTASLTEYDITISQSITAGWYYFAFNQQSGNFQATATDIRSPDFGNITSNVTSGGARLFAEDSVTGAFATAGTVTRRTDPVPLFGLRVA
jgi:hypothetical protein